MRPFVPPQEAIELVRVTHERGVFVRGIQIPGWGEDQCTHHNILTERNLATVFEHSGEHSFLCSLPFPRGTPSRLLAGRVHLSEGRGLPDRMGCNLLCPRSLGDLERARGLLESSRVEEAWLGVKRVISK